MADKKVPQEPCILCGHNPCDCGQPMTRKAALVLREQASVKEDNGGTYQPSESDG